MAPHPLTVKHRNGIERVRSRILTALHVGKLGPGDRIPSVRRLADMTGMNRKTVHRAYTALAEEGLLEIRPCGGTYVSEQAIGSSELPATSDLAGAINRVRAEASRLGLAPGNLARALATFFDDGLAGLPVAVIECNGEQLGLIERDLAARLHLDPRPVLLAKLKSDPVRAIGEIRHVVTTNCHLNEVTHAVQGLDVIVHAVSLDSEFPARVVHLASRSRGVMVVSDRVFEGVFLRLLREMSVPVDVLANIEFVLPDEAARAIRNLDEQSWVHVSPLVEREIGHGRPGWPRELRGTWHVRPDALERLRGRLSFESALEHHPDNTGSARRAG